MGFLDLFKRVLPLSDNDQYCLQLLEGEEEYEEVKRVIKEGKAKFLLQKFNISMYQDGDYFQLVSEFPELNELLMQVNAKLKLIGQKDIYSRFSKDALNLVKKIISSNIAGMNSAKDVLSLQLFSKEYLHVLLFGDNPAMKALANNAAYLSPNAVAVKAASAMANNSLSHANNGLAVIHDLMMMHRLDRADFYTALNTGFIMKEGLRMETNAKILATITPSGGLEPTVERVRSQLPEDKMISKFHLTLLGRKSIDNPQKIAIKKEDREFIQDYIKLANTINVSISKEFEADIKQFTENLKKKEYYFFTDIRENLTEAIVNMSKSMARSRLTVNVEPQDVHRAKEIVLESLKGN
ncbi:MAG: hypothetical protein Q8R00_04050 [Candidatus Nanoarchaeia archaeon]|nr:hypothetical protein [Candidatus Nanoarchaeia archaeon]